MHAPERTPHLTIRQVDFVNDRSIVVTLSDNKSVLVTHDDVKELARLNPGCVLAPELSLVH